METVHPGVIIFVNSVCIGIDTQKSISKDLLPGWPSEVQLLEFFGGQFFLERREYEDNFLLGWV